MLARSGRGLTLATSLGWQASDKDAADSSGESGRPLLGQHEQIVESCVKDNRIRGLPATKFGQVPSQSEHTQRLPSVKLRWPPTLRRLASCASSLGQFGCSKAHRVSEPVRSVLLRSSLLRTPGPPRDVRGYLVRPVSLRALALDSIRLTSL